MSIKHLREIPTGSLKQVVYENFAIFDQ